MRNTIIYLELKQNFTNKQKTQNAQWSLRNERSFDMDLIFSINLLQFIFIALRLDSIVRWHWAVRVAFHHFFID